jgi:hypothetical protein
MRPTTYQHAVDSGAYIPGVDTSCIRNRKPVSLESVGRDATVFLVIGQSNVGNHGSTRFTSKQRVFNFNPFDGECYDAADPLLGATGDDGSPLCVLGDLLIESGFAQSIIFCPVAVGGATVASWAPKGAYHQRLIYGLGALKARGLLPTHVLWHQGEGDALYGTTARAYEDTFRNLVGSLRSHSVTGPIFVAGASYFAVPEGFSEQQKEIRRAQENVLSEQNSVLRGPDTDLIPERYDGCHFSGDGLLKHARAWHDVLINTTCS